MYPSTGQLMLGFHGCDRKVGRKLVSGKANPIPSENPWDWLGHGVYFWEGDPQRAFEYAEAVSRKPRSGIRTPFVVGAAIDLGYGLNLLNRSHLELLRRSYAGLQEALSLQGQPLPANKPGRVGPDLLRRDLDCAVLNFLHEGIRIQGGQPFDTVRAAFWEGSELYGGAGFRELNHIQICVRNLNCIKGYFLPREADQAWPIP
ncbi:MAG: hypothetical protein M5U26_06430 [Planctomycetota bacterium]|nr:hypothetical protein [Planctomycetota bacterium]